MSDEALGVLAHGGVVGEGVLVAQDALVRRFDVLGLERRLSDEQRVHDDAGGPNVYLKRVPVLALEDLGRDVVGRAADCLSPLLAVREARGQAEVAHLDAHLGVDEEVAQLEVAVDDQVGVQVLERRDELREVVTRLELAQLLASLQQLRHGLEGCA